MTLTASTQGSATVAAAPRETVSAGSTRRRPALLRPRSSGRVRGLTLGVVVLWLSLIVLLPLAALTVTSFSDGWAGFWAAVTAPVALAALWTTILVSAAVALVNVVAGTLIAWVLVRDDFPGKRFVDSLIDLPFALPTIVASIVLLSLYGPNSPIGVELNATKWGLIVALAFVTLPFVVRSVQPVLIEIDRDVEQGAAPRGRGHGQTRPPGGTHGRGGPRGVGDSVRSGSGPAENAVQLRAAHGAGGLRHLRALLVDLDVALGLTLFLALHAVELAVPALRHDGLLDPCCSGRRGIPAGRRSPRPAGSPSAP